MFNIERFIKICDDEEQLFHARSKDDSKIKHAYNREQIQKAIGKFVEGDVDLNEIYFNEGNWNDPMLWLIQDFYEYVFAHGKWVKESIFGPYKKIETKNYIYAVQLIVKERRFFIRNKARQVTHYFGWRRPHGNVFDGRRDVTNENRSLSCLEYLKIIDDILEYTEVHKKCIPYIHRTFFIKL